MLSEGDQTKTPMARIYNAIAIGAAVVGIGTLLCLGVGFAGGPLEFLLGLAIPGVLIGLPIGLYHLAVYLVRRRRG